MRNAVIRKKLIKEQAIIRRYFFYPQRLIIPSMPKDDWMSAKYQHGQLGTWR